MSVIILILISFIGSHIYISINEDNSLLDFKEDIGMKIIATLCVTIGLWVVMAISLNVTEDESKFIRKVHTTEKIDVINGELAMKIEKCDGCKDNIKIKYLTTNGFLEERCGIPRKNIRFDGENKVVVYTRKRPKGFRRWFFGENTSDMIILHLDKEISKKF